MPDLRPMTAVDLPAATAIQNAVYAPLYHEDAAVLGGRITAAPTCCWGAFSDGALVAYILSHPWPLGAPPAIGESLGPCPAGDNWFIHDLAITPQARGIGLGRALVAKAAQAARDLGLSQGDLVAVQGASTFWAGLGYVAPQTLTTDLAAKVAAYGDDARYMRASLADLHP